MSSSFSPDGFLGGIYGGYNHQFSNNMVLGLDADFSLANIKNNGKYYDGGIRDPEVGNVDQDALEWRGPDPRRLCRRSVPAVRRGGSFLWEIQAVGLG